MKRPIREQEDASEGEAFHFQGIFWKAVSAFLHSYRKIEHFPGLVLKSSKNFEKVTEIR